MKRAFGYLRVSRDPKLEKLSPEVQRQRIAEACRVRKWELVQTYEDIDVPSHKIDAAGTWKALSERLSPGDVIVTNEFTRIGRNLRQTLARIDRLHEQGAELVSLEGDLDTTTAAGKLQYQVLLVLAEFERNRMSERLCQTHTQIAREGRWKGGPLPLGYTYTPGAKVLEVHPEEAEVVREIYALRDSGVSVNNIVREMDKRGIRGKKGARLDYSAVSQTLKNPTYIGKRSHKGEIFDGLHNPVVEVEVWERVQARRRTGDSQRQYLLSGFLHCSCGSRMVHQTSPGRKLYVCKRARQFRDVPLTTIEEHLADTWITEAFFDHVDHAKLTKARKRKPPATRDLKGERSKIDKALERLVSDQYGAGDPPFTPEQFRARNAELLGQRDELARQVQAVEDRARLDNVVRIGYRGIRDSWPGMALDEQREALRLFVEKVEVGPGTRKKNDTGRIRVIWRY